ncbi:BMP family lipoprotein [Maridesulfovibrio sp.]|uniref:BMP family lipoprotein n=1 Tax=Maridesulfovibrio sp. TaxID=2795000 RepID=UPI0029F463DA|nr:BMP family ABC transporter substrate-binding protein [Maridesulfovibrio sp.]
MFKIRLISIITCFVVLCLIYGSAICHAKDVKVGFIYSGDTINDNSFNEMVATGLRKLQKEQHVRVLPRRGGFSMEETVGAIESLLAEGVRVILVNGVPYGNRLGVFALDHADTTFIINDAKIEGYPNIISIDYAHGMGSCLVGALCAWQTKTGKIGFLGANEMPVVKEFLTGFRKGVEYSGQDVEILVRYIRPGVSLKGFEDPKQAYTMAMNMYADGVDIIYSVAGLSGNGAIQAAHRTGNLVVGVDSDQDYMAKGSVLTSMIKRMDIAVYKEVLAIVNGTSAPGCKTYHLANDGVGLSDMTYTRHLLKPGVLKKLGELKAKLISGEVKPDASVK